MVLNPPKSITKIDPYLSFINVANALHVWVYKDEEIRFLVDPGPMGTIRTIKRTLRKLEIGENDLDYILLTHIHTDHAGCVGKLIELFPHSKIICHPNGIPHLINPDKLYEKTLKVLGKGGELAGKFLSVPKDRIISQNNIEQGTIKVIETLGHAPHHQCYLFKNYLFIGEAAGSIFPIPELEFLYPATPPIFDYDIYVSSIEKLLSENLTDYIACYPHLGMRENAHKMIKLGYQQIKVWLHVFNSLYEDREKPEFLELLMTELKKEDKIFSKFDQLDNFHKTKVPAVIRDSIKGILRYIEKKKEANEDLEIHSK
ncbi:MAG: MBL fold metallo-hydrolase [Promethearchaeota archaeon]|jgi:glyoxylase-like metal-dependent hydrolase (beta-lactamase superfamily II)